MISVIKVNGETIDESREAGLAMRSLSQVGSIEITNVDQIELAFERFAPRTLRAQAHELLPLKRR